MKNPNLKMRRFLAVALSMALSACAKDKDLNDWRRQQMSEDLAELSSAAGTFRGSLVSKESGDPIGALEMTLTPQIRVIPGQSGEKADGQPTLAARLTFADSRSRLAITALDSFFDPQNGTLEVSVNLTRSSGRSEQLIISGVLTDQTLAGQLQVTGASEMAGKFELRKNSFESLAEISQKLESQRSSSRSSPTEAGEAQAWLGSTTFKSGDSRPVSLVFVEPSLSPEEQFLNRFAPVQILQFALNYGDSLKLIHTGALWDRRTGRLSGHATLGSDAQGTSAAGSSTMEIITECQSLQNAWTCTHQSPGAGLVASTQVSSQPMRDDAAADEAPDTRRIQQLHRSGTTTLNSGTVDTQLHATYAARTREQELTDLFSPVPEKMLTVSLQFAIPNAETGEKLTVVFDRAILDTRSHTLDARTQLRQGAGIFEVQLRCQSFEFPELERRTVEKAGPASCQYSSSHRSQPITIQFP